MIAAIALGLVLLLALIWLLVRPGDPGQDKLSDEQAVGDGEAPDGGRCAAQATYDRIKLELFRRAAETRGSDRAVFERFASYSSVRVERPLVRARDEELGTLRCSGRLSLDLPPGVAVVGGRRTLTADIEYVLQPAADGSGDVVMLDGADAIIVPLATLARSGDAAAPAAGDPALEPTGEPGEVPDGPDSAAPLPDDEAPDGPVNASAAPSFNCRFARTRGEIAVCGDDRLAALDRQMAAQYAGAVAAADPRQRALLSSTRRAFLQFRDQCPNNPCIAETYRGRMREIRDIMAGTWRPDR